MTRARSAAIAATIAAFAALAALVTQGSLASIDQYAVDHWMADLDPERNSGSTSLLHELYPHLGTPLQVFCNFWTYPASPLISALLVAGSCAVLVRRGLPAAAVAWASAWIAGNLIEILGKHFLHRPALHALVGGTRISFDSFGHSFPSGHAIRAIITVTLLATVWRRAALPALLWTPVALAALVVGAAHTPSDIAGGVLVALLGVLSVQAILRARASVA